MAKVDWEASYNAKSAEVERLKAELDKAKLQRDAMFHEIETLRGKTGYCIECEKLKAENDRLRKVGDAAAGGGE